MVWDFIVKFFGYFNNNGNVSSFSDTLGEGSFGWRHFLWILIVIILAIGGYVLFRKYQKVGKKIVYFLVISLFSIRFFHQSLRAIIGVETPWTRAFPFHMCTVLTFLLPLTIVFDWKKIKTPVFVLAIMGGVITMLMGEYFDSRFMTFWTLEGMAAHSILILVPIYEAATNRFKFDFKESWKVLVGILVLMAWAMIANLVFFPNTDSNYMYLMENALPFGSDQTYFLIYTLIFAFFFGIIYGIPVLTRRLEQMRIK